LKKEQRVLSRRQFVEKQMEDLKVKAKTITDQAHEADKPEWEQLEGILKEKGLLDDYNPATDHITFNLKKNTVEICSHRDGDDKDHNPLHDLLRGLFR
jgi:hypothetical protein